MARITPLLRALATEQWRDLRALAGVGSNHFVLFALLVFATQPATGAFLPGLVGLLLLIPASVDPLRRLPAERLSLLPFGERDRLRLRAVGLALSPVVWLAIALLFFAGGKYRAHVGLLLILAITSNACLLARERFLGAASKRSPFRWLPAIPGRLGGLIRKNLRETLMQLDPYVGLLLSLSGLAYRLAAPQPVPEALFGLRHGGGSPPAPPPA